jgi:hypothetical protein
MGKQKQGKRVSSQKQQVLPESSTATAITASSSCKSTHEKQHKPNARAARSSRLCRWQHATGGTFDYWPVTAGYTALLELHPLLPAACLAVSTASAFWCIILAI